MTRPKNQYGLLTGLNWRPFVLLALLLIGCLPDGPIVPIPDPINPPVPVVPGVGRLVLIVEETSRRDRLLPEQVDIFTSAVFRKTLAEAKTELRIWDQDVDLENESDAAFKALLQQPRQSLPWLIVTGRPGFSGPLPKTMAETLTVIASQK